MDDVAEGILQENVLEKST